MRLPTNGDAHIARHQGLFEMLLRLGLLSLFAPLQSIPFALNFTLRYNMSDREFLSWIYERLHFVHGENENVDYMQRLKRIVNKCPKCGDHRQVWVNQITGKLTCHTAFCHTEIK